MKLFIKGTRCASDKCALSRREYPPGQHGKNRIKLSDYSVQLREKQKVRRIYGILERQFQRYFGIAQKAKGVTGQQLLEMLERRLDNVLHRTGFATSRHEAREMVRHRAGFGYSQLSQRYVPERDAAMVEPDVIAADPELHALFTEAAEANRIRVVQVEAPRGRILDREGHDLALSVLRPSVFADPSQIEDPLASARVLAPVLGMDAQGSAAGRDAPFCKSSIEMPLGLLIKAMRPSRGGRLMTTPAFCNFSQYS